MPYFVGKSNLSGSAWDYRWPLPQWQVKVLMHFQRYVVEREQDEVFNFFISEPEPPRSYLVIIELRLLGLEHHLSHTKKDRFLAVAIA